MVLDFSKIPGDLDKPGRPRWGYGPAIGQVDQRTPRERFFRPDHPHVQPRPDDPSWRTYPQVPNGDSSVANRPAVPAAKRPADENWLNDTGSPPPSEPFRFKSLPDVKPPDAISVTYVRTPDGIFPARDPYSLPPGTNMLKTVYGEAFDGEDKVVANSLPSTEATAYNLHEGNPSVSRINPRSPTEDLQEILDTVYTLLTGSSPKRLWENLDRQRYEDTLKDLAKQEPEIRRNLPRLRHYLRMAIDILEGKEVPDRAYSGFRLLHHSGQTRVTRVVPTTGATPNPLTPNPVNKPGCTSDSLAVRLSPYVTGGNARVHQVWFDGRIESDTMFIDTQGEYDSEKERCELPPIPPKVPWTITYTIDVLNRGRDDFAATTMFFDTKKATADFFAAADKSPDGKGRIERERNQFRLRSLDVLRPDGKPEPKPTHPAQIPLVSMDQSFFPMESGTRTVLTVKMPPPEYYNLTYSWGWRFHPPRAQAMEHAAKRQFGDSGKSIVEYEREVFKDDPDPAKAVGMLGDLAPAKRMWRAFNTVLKALDDPDHTQCLTQLLDARNAFLDWKDRNHLPSGLEPDPESDLTVLFANNTTYGHLRDGGWVELPKWRARSTPVKVTLLNADYFEHQYLNVEWGGNRGWEPQFKPTLKLGGSGTFFSFGRFHYQFNTPPGKITVPAAKRFKNGKEITDGLEVPDTVKPGVHRLWIEMNHEPSRRLRFYQFDPTHHDVAIYSLH